MQKIKYQGVARDVLGLPISNQNISVKVSLIQDSPTGSTIYSEYFNISTNAFGLFAINIGEGVVISGNFTSISWGSHDYFQQVELDPAGGSAYAMVGVSQLMSVPYALYAETSGNCGFSNMQIFNVSGNFIIPANVKKIMVEVWGGGGGGGLVPPIQDMQNGGGGGGYGKEIFIVIPGINYNIVIGYGGAGSTLNGMDGGITSFGNLISANGGGGGYANGGFGGTSSAAFNIMGQDAYRLPGWYSSGGILNGGTGGIAGMDGRIPGGGGGSGYNLSGTFSGGKGADGRVVVWW